MEHAYSAKQTLTLTEKSIFGVAFRGHAIYFTPMIIADLTGANPHTEAGLLQIANNQLGPFGFGKTIILCAQHQVADIESWKSIANIIPLPTNHYSGVSKWIFDYCAHPSSAQGFHEIITIISFHATLRRQCQTNLPGYRAVVFKHWMEIKASDSPAAPPQVALDPLLNFPLSENEIINCIVNALKSRSRPVRITDLRGFLIDQNPVFDKQRQLTPPGFISKIVQLAERKGLVRYIQNGMGQAKEVELVADSSPISTPEMPSSPSAVLAPVQVTQQSINLPAPTASRPSAVPIAPPPVELNSAKPISPKDLVPRRSDVFFRILRENDFGPFSAIRTDLYESISSLVDEKRFTANAILRQSVSKLIEMQGQESRFPWYPVTQFLFNLFGAECVLLDENGNPLDPNHPNSFALVVHGLRDNWRDLLDSTLLSKIISIDKQVKAFDIPDLSGVLYNSRGDDQQLKIERLLKTIDACGRLLIDSNKCFQVKN